VTRLTTCPDAASVAARAAEHVTRELRRAVDERGVFHLALSGGTTPAGTYERLAVEVGDWSAVELWFADERCVPPDDQESNYRLVAETLLASVARAQRGSSGSAGSVGADVPAERIHRMPGELGPGEGARAYAIELRDGVGPGEDGLPVLDLVVLGIGPDGHVASLFPGSPALDADAQLLCVGIQDSPKPPPRRITLTLGVLRAARGCLLLATGASKADAVSAMLGKPSRHVPASLLRRERLTVMLDDAASPPGPPQP
jgi:6-phosphogluconolactonase